MLHQFETIKTFCPVSYAILIAVALGSGAAFAEEPTVENRATIGAAPGALGLGVGALTGAGAGWVYDKLNPMTPPTTPPSPARQSVVDRSSMTANGAKWKEVEVEPPPGASERTSVRQREMSREYKRDPRAFKQKYHNHREGWDLGEEHANAVDEAKAKQARDLKADKARKQAERRARKQARRNGITEMPKRATRHERSVRRMDRKGAMQFKRGNTIQTLREKAWELDGKPMKNGHKALPKIRTGTAAAKQQANAAKAAKNAGGAAKVADTASDARKGAKLAKTGAKMGRVAKGALAGGAVGMVAGAALGVQVPDAVDATLFAGKLISDPKNADKMIAEAGDDGVKMVGTALTTVTNPAKIVSNLGNAAKGVGGTIQDVGDAIGVKGVLRAKGSVRTHVDANGKCTTNSIWYRCKLQNARDQRAATSGRTTYVFKPYNPASGLSASLSNSGRSIARTYHRGTRQIDRGVTRTAYTAQRFVNRTTRSVGSSLGRSTYTAQRSFNRTTRNAGRSINRTAYNAQRSFNRTTRNVGRSINRSANNAKRSFNRTTRNVGRSIDRTARSVGRGLQKAFRFK